MTGRRSWIRSIIGLSALMLAFAGPSRAQSPDVPETWIAYAQLVGHQFQTWLEANDDNANALHQYLEEHVPDASGDASPPSIGVRAWIDADGRVTRVEFNSLGDADADAVLHRLLTGHLMTKPPPPDMLQPLRVRLNLTANPVAAQ
jgi:hypothetical protein